MEKVTYSYLKSLLYNEIKDYEENVEEKDDLKLKRDLLYEIVNILNQDKENMLENKMTLYLLMDSVFSDSINNEKMQKVIAYYLNDRIIDEEQLEQNATKKEKLKNKIEREYEEVNNEYLVLQDILSSKTEKIIGYKTILSALKFKKIINSELVSKLENLLEQYEYSSKDKIKFLELIRSHNAVVRGEYGKDSFKIYDLIQMLDYGYVDFSKELETYGNEEVKKHINSHKRQIMFIDDVSEFIDYLKEYNSTLDKKIVKDSMIGLMNYFQEELITASSLLGEMENYKNLQSRNALVYEIGKNHMYLRKIYNLYEEQFGKDRETETKEAINEDKKVLLFSHSEIDSFALKDLGGVPNEYYGKVSSLLEKFKDNDPTISTRAMGDNLRLKGLKEIKDDQIRIFYRHLTDDKYCILGVAVKKQDLDRSLLSKMATRPIPNYEDKMDIEVEKGKIEFDKITEFCKENKRLGNR